MLTSRRRTSRLTLLMLPLLILSRGLRAQDASVLADADRDSKLRSRIQSLVDLHPEAKKKVSVDLRKESQEHFGFPAIRSIEDAAVITFINMPASQKRLIDETTMHVVDGNLMPIAVTQPPLKPTGQQIYPDLQQALRSSPDADILAIAAKVGRIRYWDRNNLRSTEVKESDAGLAGTGFVIGKGLIATACHVLDYLVDRTTGDLSDKSWAKIDFGADPNTHQAYLVTGIAGIGTIQGQDFAILFVSPNSEIGSTPLPDPVTMGSDSSTKFVGVIGYPDIAGATGSCASQTSRRATDRTNAFQTSRQRMLA